MSKDLIYGFLMFFMLHTIVWFSTNLQFVNKFWQEKSFLICMALAIPASFCGYYASKLCFAGLDESAWAVRFIGFGTSYFIFPVLTYVMLNESMFTAKTLSCIALSFVIIGIQIFWR